MALSQIILWKYKQNSKGECLLMLRVHKHGKRKLISTKKAVKESDWDKDRSEVISVDGCTSMADEGLM